MGSPMCRNSVQAGQVLHRPYILTLWLQLWNFQKLFGLAACVHEAVRSLLRLRAEDAGSSTSEGDVHACPCDWIVDLKEHSMQPVLTNPGKQVMRLLTKPNLTLLLGASSSTCALETAKDQVSHHACDILQCGFIL